VWAQKKDRPRFVFARGVKPTIISPVEPLTAQSSDDWWVLPAEKRLPADATFYVGERDGDVMWRIMDKVIDTQNPEAGTQTELGADERRVRIEVTLQGQELLDLAGFELSELDVFSFTRLQGSYFSFRLPTFRDTAGPPTVGTLSARVIERRRRRIYMDVGVLGLGAFDVSRAAWNKPHHDELRAEFRRQGRKLERPRVGAGSFRTMVVWEKMNKKVETALRHLQKRVRDEMRQADEARAGSS
jgi:hypothetical protein